MEQRYPGQSAAGLIKLGQTACTAVEAYDSVALALVAIAKDPSWSVQEAKDAGYVFGAAIPAFCPEYESELRALTK